MLRHHRFSLLMFLSFTFILVAPSAWAACEICKGPFGNRSCRSVAADESGYSDCANDFFGNCINGTSSCTGTSCGKDICEEHQDTRLELPIAPGGEILTQPALVCAQAELIIEA